MPSTFTNSAERARSRSALLFLLTVQLFALLSAQLWTAVPNAHAGHTIPIKIAGIFALTGAATANNAPSVAGFRAAVADVNAEGGVRGRRLSPLLLDNLSTPIGSLVATRKADEAGAVAIIGPVWSTHALAAAREAQTRGIPMISNIATNPNVTTVGDYIFRACFTDLFQGQVMASFARHDLKAQTAAVMTDITSDFSIGLSREFIYRFSRAGGTVPAELTYKPRWPEFDTLVHKARAADTDVCFLPGHDESGVIVKKMAKVGVRCLPLGGDGWTTKSFLERGGAALDQGFFCGHWSKESDAPASRAIVERYGATEHLDSSWVLAYDAVRLFADAARRANSIERRDVRDALAATRDFEGATGNITFDPNGDPVKDAVILEMRDGEPHFYKRVTPDL